MATDEYTVEQHDGTYFIKRLSDDEYLPHLHFGDRAAAVNYIKFGLEGGYVGNEN